MQRLWVHEVFRVYYDRLVFDEDRQWLIKYVNESLKKQFNTNYNILFKHLDSNGDGRTFVQVEYLEVVHFTNRHNLLRLSLKRK